MLLLWSPLIPSSVHAAQPLHDAQFAQHCAARVTLHETCSGVSVGQLRSACGTHWPGSNAIMTCDRCLHSQTGDIAGRYPVQVGIPKEFLHVTNARGTPRDPTVCQRNLPTVKIQKSFVTFGQSSERFLNILRRALHT
jgi:hypothetical protein